MKSTSVKCSIILSFACAHGVALRAENAVPVAKWSFEDNSTTLAQDSASGLDDTIVGWSKHVAGVVGHGLQFDGYTTGIRRPAAATRIESTKGALPVASIPVLTKAFTFNAWIALNAYPWNWVPVIDQSIPLQAGYFFGIDAFGHVGLQLAVDGRWLAVTSDRRLPLKRWVQVSATFDSERGMAVYINGEEAGFLATHGVITPADKTDLLIGRIRQPELPVPADSIHPLDPVWFSLEGILDEIEIIPQTLSSADIRNRWVSAHVAEGEILPWARLPSGPPGSGRFGAYPCSLTYDESWDGTRRMGPDTDVVVRFDRSPMRLVFWQGTSFVPSWVTENGKWYTDEFLEAYGPPGCTGGEDCEPMSDKQVRYSHVSIVENNDARAVVHWRYALSETRNYAGSFSDPLTGWFDWADEYWTVYPDGTAVRRQVLWTSDLGADAHEWQESIIINGPGERPEDNINLDAITLANMKGETETYRWVPKSGESFDYPNGPTVFSNPAGPNIQVVNLKSVLKPFQIVPPEHTKMTAYNGEKSYSTFEWWNHWPVAQIPSSGRPALAADRASHTSLSHIYWDFYRQTSKSLSKLLLCGLTDKVARELVPLAKSWLTPPRMEVAGRHAKAIGFDPAERAFVLMCPDSPSSGAINVTLHASADSPVINPALVVRGWDADARVKVNGKAIPRGASCRVGHNHRLDGDDLVIWIEMDFRQPTLIEIAPE